MSQGPPTPRTPADVSTLLVELGRAVRGLQYYPEGDPTRDELLDRSFQAWQAELARNGPLELEVRRGAFWLGGSDAAVGRGRLDELAREFAARGLHRLRFDPDLEPAALRELAAQLASSGAEPPAATSTGAVSEFLTRLRELEDCGDDARYPDLAAAVTDQALALARSGASDEAYRALLVLSVHAGKGTRRSSAQRAVAHQAVRRMAAEAAVFEDLIDRARVPGSAESVRAAQLLLLIGEEAVRPLLDRLQEETDAEGRGQLSGILIAMSAAGPELVRALEKGSPCRRRLAARLAGESQNPLAVPALGRLLTSPDEELRREAAKALVRIGDGNALRVLAQALDSPVAGVSGLAAFCLGATRRPEAIRPLVAALENAVGQRRSALARETLRALGRLGRSEATPALAALLQRKSVLWRGGLRAVQEAAVAALGHMPGEAAHRVLEAAAQGSDARVREAASRALRQRAQSAGPQA